MKILISFRSFKDYLKNKLRRATIGRKQVERAFILALIGVAAVSMTAGIAVGGQDSTFSIVLPINITPAPAPPPAPAPVPAPAPAPSPAGGGGGGGGGGGFFGGFGTYGNTVPAKTPDKKSTPSKKKPTKSSKTSKKPKATTIKKKLPQPMPPRKSAPSIIHIIVKPPIKK